MPYFSGMFYYLFFPAVFIFATPLWAQQSGAAIRLNQEGFYTKGPKLAIVTGTTSVQGFSIVSVNGRDTVFRGKLSSSRQSAYSSTTTRIADFSQWQKQGKYMLYVPGVGNSYPFQIANDVHHQAALAALKAFYFMRVSMPLEEKYAGKWHRGAGHPDTAVVVHPSAASAERPTGTVLASPGGWYDAGDYNKYVVNSGITMGTLFSAYEDFPQYFQALKTNIPESGNEVPDILDEALYNLRWMLTMQDPYDGGVYHKCTNAAFDGMVMPGVTKLPRYVVQKSTAAALDFAAVMAQAARIIKPFNRQLPGLQDSCLRAAVYAWQWAQKNPAVVYDQEKLNQQFQPSITTGAYGDRSLKDEWFWAAAELFSTTQQKTYYDTLLSRRDDAPDLPSWSNTRLLGYYTLIRTQKQLPSFSHPLIALFKTQLLSIADDYITKAQVNAFATVMGQSVKDFIWGSNAVAANQGILLINAYLFSGNKKYLNYALTNLDYILGRNATGYCFVTGIGDKSPMHPHHRPSVADGIPEPVPGLVAGGPNPGRQDKCTYPYTEPETAYTDDDCSYASNEIAINWNAPMMYLANAIEALQDQLGDARNEIDRQKRIK
ncbi:MAG: glycoside hydrolase family 9 protein [Bacteroidota bacterium]|nr:glycoside hydrolase family 9 protein [Bacteroidota bacterium]